LFKKNEEYQFESFDALCFFMREYLCSRI